MAELKEKTKRLGDARPQGVSWMLKGDENEGVNLVMVGALSSKWGRSSWRESILTWAKGL